MSGRWRVSIATGLTAIAGFDSSHAFAVPEVKLANLPLSASSGNVHPNMLLSLSLEYPVIGIAYRADDGNYNRTSEYIGYFNPRKCYRYIGGNRNINDGYFSIRKNADTAYECGGDSFSGNFMNWASSSVIDLLRYGLTGGDRIVDTPGQTILQRAVLKEEFYANPRYFPRRILRASPHSSAPSQVTPFNPDTLYIVSCRNRILFSDSQNSGNNCDTPAFDRNGVLAKTDKRLGDYLVRVQVCDSADGLQRTDLCQKYGAAYKPVGTIQQHADKIRFSAMGYLLDDSATRYGGVLRAPMKYVGARKFLAPGFNDMANDELEWDPATGMSYANPDDKHNRSSSTLNSGVINYLNKSGRSGVYKSLDPVGELFYEGVRYLQGKQPSSQASAGMTYPMKDGFPVIETWKDPVTTACQRNYIVSIADVNTNWDRYIPGNIRTRANGATAHDAPRAAEAAVPSKTPELDVRLWTRKVGEMEADLSGMYANAAPRPDLANLQNMDTGEAGHGSYYMAGLAYWANTNDIRLDKPVRIKTVAINIDDGGNTHLLKPGSSQLYLAAKYGGFTDRNNDGNPFVTLGADGKRRMAREDTEWDGNGDGIPDNYFQAAQPNDMVQSIRGLFASVAAASVSAAGITLSASRISTDGAFIFQAGFDPFRWSGSLSKRALRIDANGVLTIAQSSDWDAGVILTSGKGKMPHPTPENRKIFTAKINDDRSISTVPFLWSDLTAGQKAVLDTSPVDNAIDHLGEKRLHYLRGKRHLEQGNADGIFRARHSVLGDIINSSPVHAGAPAAAVQDQAYRKFFDEHQSRPGVVYVGANDGMLHAFDAADGEELFAYVPNGLIHKLNQLTAPGYVHRPYVDGAISVSDALAGGEWKTVLASGMGGGAQGIFVLDVSNPARFGAGSGVIMEFTDDDDADMGNITSAPLVAKFRTKMTNGVPEYKYFIVVPSGFNNYKDDGPGKFNDKAPGVLFLFSLDKSPQAKWKLNVNYYKIKVPAMDAGMQSALASPALVIGNDGAVRYAYAGDLQGNLWRFDFTGSAPWTAALGPTPAKPLFTAMDVNQLRQPITTQPKVVFAPGPGVVVLFGTGKFVEDADAAPGNFSTQSFYGIHDTWSKEYKVTSRHELVGRSLAASPADSHGVMNISGEHFSYAAAGGEKKGWYVDFAASRTTGERSVSNALVASGWLYFNTLIPGSDPCGISGGRSYALNTLTGLTLGGSATGYLSEVGLLSYPILIEMETQTGERDAIGRRIVKKKHTILNSGPGGRKGNIAASPGGSAALVLPAGRFSWREVPNWQELHDAFKKK